MNTEQNQSRGGHVGVGGIQAWSAGDLFPWTIYTIEHYVPLTVVRGGVEYKTGVEDRSIDERFLWAEIRMRCPAGGDIELVTYLRGEDSGEANRKAQRKAEHCLRVWRAMDDMARIMSYGQPKLSHDEVTDHVVELAQMALATCRPQAPEAVKGTLDRNEEGYNEVNASPASANTVPVCNTYEHATIVKVREEDHPMLMKIKAAVAEEKALAAPIANTVPVCNIAKQVWVKDDSEVMVNPPYVEPFKVECKEVDYYGG